MILAAAPSLCFFSSGRSRNAWNGSNGFSLRLAQGDFRPLPAERSNDELAELTQALNETAAWMDRTIRSLSGERNRSSAILRSMVEGVAVIDAQERLVFSNRAFSEILNLDSASSEGTAPDRSDPQHRVAGIDSPGPGGRGRAAERYRDGNRAAAELFGYGRAREGAGSGRRRRPVAACEIRNQRTVIQRNPSGADRGAARRDRIAASGARAPGFRGQRFARIQDAADRDSRIRRNAARRRDRRSAEQPPFSRNHSRSCHPAGAPDRRPVEAGADRGGQAGGAIFSGGCDRSGRSAARKRRY